ncbi:hypothetical protein C7M84_009978, partial [Penaeus vannamei]
MTTPPPHTHTHSSPITPFPLSSPSPTLHLPLLPLSPTFQPSPLSLPSPSPLSPTAQHFSIKGNHSHDTIAKIPLVRTTKKCDDEPVKNLAPGVLPRVMRKKQVVSPLRRSGDEPAVFSLSLALLSSSPLLFLFPLILLFDPLSISCHSLFFSSSHSLSSYLLFVPLSLFLSFSPLLLFPFSFLLSLSSSFLSLSLILVLLSSSLLSLFFILVSLFPFASHFLLSPLLSRLPFFYPCILSSLSSHFLPSLFTPPILSSCSFPPPFRPLYYSFSLHTSLSPPPFCSRPSPPSLLSTTSSSPSPPLSLVLILSLSPSSPYSYFLPLLLLIPLPFPYSFLFLLSLLYVPRPFTLTTPFPLLNPFLFLFLVSPVYFFPSSLVPPPHYLPFPPLPPSLYSYCTTPPSPLPSRPFAPTLALLPSSFPLVSSLSDTSLSLSLSLSPFFLLLP